MGNENGNKTTAYNARFGATAAVTRKQFCANLQVHPSNNSMIQFFFL